ncbi:MAG: hypothetical protein BGO78_01045 [Chloroflexi bacterium 44-23]|nr:MAG: hypothetical protein BGO78_01045 [Chloroflexi bacterium 44-23]
MANHLIEAKELHQRITDPNIIIVDCRFDLADPDWGHADYLREHIPGAVYAHLDHDLSSPITATSGRHPLPNPDSFVSFLSKAGIDSSKTVVVYDTAFGAFAARLWWLLRSYGHEDVLLLNGGFSAWKKENFPLESGQCTNKPAVFQGQFSNKFLVKAKELEATLMNPDFVLIDARAANRYIGIEEPIDTIAGHIPGAKNVFHQANLDAEGYFLPEKQLKRLYQFSSKTIKGENIILYCGSGVTSCLDLVALAQIGIENARLYAGSWSEWIRDPKRPKITP